MGDITRMRHLAGATLLLTITLAAGCTASPPPGSTGPTDRGRPAPDATFNYILGSGGTDACAADTATVCGFDWREGEDESLPADHPDNVAAVTARRQAIARLHDQHELAIAYIDAGGWETYRRDWDTLAGAGHLGGSVAGWPQERWVNFTGDHHAAVLAALESRVAEAEADGFDAVDFDLVEASDAGAAEVGFAVGDGEQAAFDRELFRLARAHGMGAWMKGFPRLAGDMAADADAWIVEECLADARRQAECVAATPRWAGKLIVAVEYVPEERALVADPAKCAMAAANGWHMIFKRLDLDPTVAYC